MAQKKNDAVLTADDKMIQSADELGGPASFVNTFWKQFEISRERAIKVSENREDAFLNAVKEVIKFNKQYRESIANLYDQSRKTNKEVVSELRHQFGSEKDKMNPEVNVEEVHAGDREGLKKQLKEVSGQLEKLALTPIKSVFQMVDQFENNLKKNTESTISFNRDRRNAWLQVRNEYVNLAKNTHINLVDRGLNGIKELVKAK